MLAYVGISPKVKVLEEFLPVTDLLKRKRKQMIVAIGKQTVPAFRTFREFRSPALENNDSVQTTFSPSLRNYCTVCDMKCLYQPVSVSMCHHLQ